MLFIAFKRLWTRIGLTTLSILGVTLAVGLVVSIPVFARAMSFVVLREELRGLVTAEERRPYSLRVYVEPTTQYELSLEQARVLENHIAETLASEVGLPLVARHRQMQTMGVLVRAGNVGSGGRLTYKTVYQNTRLTVLPGVESKLTIVDGVPMDGTATGIRTPTGEMLDIWIHHVTARKEGLSPGNEYQVYDARKKVSIPIRIAGTWRATDPLDPFWPQDPDRALGRALLVREADYRAVVEPLFEEQLRLASWHVLLDHDQITPENMQECADGLRVGQRLIEQYFPDPIIDHPLLEALDTALKRESDLTIQMFVFSVPVMGFLLYFLSLISAITVRWQQRETAQMVSRGMHRGQLLTVSVVEAGLIIGLGLPVGIAVGTQLARAMGYTESFVRFAWHGSSRAPLPVSPAALNVPLLIAALSASLLARLWPVLRSTRTSVVAHERRRARAPRRPFWQRTYMDFALLIPVIYAYRQLSAKGTLVPQGVVNEAATVQSFAPSSGRGDPLLFLAPALFLLALSLLLVRLFPITMRIGDWLSALGRQVALYLAFRQLARQSNQYVSALLLVITSLSLGGFMASLAASLDGWLLDQVHYAVGTDVFVKQMYNPAYLAEGIIPSDGAWMLPVQSYLDVPGIAGAARAGIYPATIQLSGYQVQKAMYIGVDRLDLPGLFFFRSDFAAEPLGSLMNRLALREDAVLVSDRVMEMGHFQVGDRIPVNVVLVDLFGEEVSLSGDFVIAGTYTYFPTVYERSDERTAVIGNLDYLFEQVGGPELHDLWLQIEPGADKRELMARLEDMRVYIRDWVEAREEIAEELAKPERVGTFGTLSVGFLAAALFSGIGLLIYNYASLQERLFRFTILRAVGLSLAQVVSQVTIEYGILMLYSIAGGAAIGVWASKLFIPFFQAADESVLRPPTLIPLIAWQDIGRISGAFAIVMVLAQIAVIAAVLRKGVFQALRLGDLE